MGSNDRFFVEAADNGVAVGSEHQRVAVGAALATLEVPARPGRFSTMTCCFQGSESRSAMVRASKLLMLPAENGTTRRTVCLGYFGSEDLGQPCARGCAGHDARGKRQADAVPKPPHLFL